VFISLKNSSLFAFRQDHDLHSFVDCFSTI
jgi:hypothetical protein